MKFIDKLLKPVLKKIIVNRWNYNNDEFQKAAELGLFDVFTFETLRQWIKAEPICSNHCSGCHTEGKPFYFNALGLLIRHKCPPFICIHGLSQISPIIYIYYDYLLQRKKTRDFTFSYVTCTDIGLKMGGLGDNLFKISVEKMPFLEFARFILSMSKYIFIKNRKAVGKCKELKNLKKLKSTIVENEFIKNLPISSDELKEFLNSVQRVNRLKAIEKFKDCSIAIKVMHSEGCIAGHKKGDEFLINSIGVVEKGMCIMALHKIWWRVILMFERMTYSEVNEENFKSKIFDLPINCYGAGFPVGSCGEILMKVELKKR